MKKQLIILLVLCVLALGILYYLGAIPAIKKEASNGYQAVFLTNGQVYFGKLYAEASQYPTLREVFYLQVTQAPQPIPPGVEQPTNINIVKLGGELHGPSDEMRINRDHVLFIEDLRADSRVLDAINQFKASTAQNP